MTETNSLTPGHNSAVIEVTSAGLTHGKSLHYKGMPSCQKNGDHGPNNAILWSTRVAACDRSVRL